MFTKMKYIIELKGSITSKNLTSLHNNVSANIKGSITSKNLALAQ